MTRLALRLMTANQLRKAEAAHRAASLRAEAARENRNRAVLDAIAAGWSHAHISDATGITRSRVGQIAKMQDVRAARPHP
jgi:hypothetical protein